MIKGKKNILFIPKWYPNVDDDYQGIFIHRHAKCAAIYNNGNNNIFNNTNLEGSSGYDYAIFDNQGTNIYNNVRLEGTSAKVYVSNVGSTFNESSG